MNVFEEINQEYEETISDILEKERQKNLAMVNEFKKQSEDRIAKMVEDTKAELEALGITL